MKRNELEFFVNQLPETESSYPFGPEAMVYKVAGKMFALIAFHQNEERVTVKGMPADNELLVSQFSGIMPGYHMNKQHWLTVSLEQDVNAGMICDLVKGSYQLVVSKLPKAERNRLILQGN
ncbi:MmcQ/YjbR family DNA-binding protein [Photobacterium nomapromontoriensis]|uniref:MmcQ/YjbR family DNA-binding protein n=1 Tax=Photobacterium nomapromontoriensis TaxID=2910237 RepID=UPI003D0CD775